MSVKAIFEESDLGMAVDGLESTADGRILSRAAVVSCLRTAVPLGPRETSLIQRMVHSPEQEEMARTQSLYDTRFHRCSRLANLSKLRDHE
jgi:hypothetical protein